MSSSARKPPRAPSRAPSQPAARSDRTSGEAAARRVASTAAQEVRILGGQWRRTPLPVPVSSGLRPTPSRVRETLFNWLGQDLTGWRVLDAFAGSGALGLEAASRGAQAVVLIEREPALVRNLRGVLARLKADTVELVQADGIGWMTQSAQASRFDLVFLDPPFDEGLFAAALQAAMRTVVPGGWIYLEAAQPWPQLLQTGEGAAPPEALAGLRLHRAGQAGAVHFHLFQREADA